jgi:hypothetical protein
MTNDLGDGGLLFEAALPAGSSSANALMAVPANNMKHTAMRTMGCLRRRVFFWSITDRYLRLCDSTAASRDCITKKVEK